MTIETLQTKKSWIYTRLNSSCSEEADQIKLRVNCVLVIMKPSAVVCYIKHDVLGVHGIMGKG